MARNLQTGRICTRVPWAQPVACRLNCDYSTYRADAMKYHLRGTGRAVSWSHVAAGHLDADEVENVLLELWRDEILDE